jgi:hypothetical protein
MISQALKGVFMKMLILVLVFLQSSFVFAQSISTDFGRHTGDNVKKLSPQDLRERLEVLGNVYVTSADGTTLLFEEAEFRSWKFGRKGDLISHWSYSSDRIEPFSIKHHWTVDEKGSLQVHLQQYEKIEANSKEPQKPKLIHLLREEKKAVADFSPLTWVVVKNDKYRVVVRLTPVLIKKEEAKSVGAVPVSAQEMMIADNKGQVWVSSATFSGEYVGIKSHRGSVYLSYLPFKGSKEIGFAQNNKIQLQISEGHNLTMLSAAPVLPAGVKAKVYGMVKLQNKSLSAGSVHIQSSDQEKEFLEVL